uniref:Uncharacterized protein n=1 Tax=Arundo donax TaxID=35708 RepID=A0A0A9EE01_ARUDO
MGYHTNSNILDIEPKRYHLYDTVCISLLFNFLIHQKKSYMTLRVV